MGLLSTDGLLAVEGRIAGNTQVKFRGHRIELAAIERVMIEEAAGILTHAMATLRRDDKQEAVLAAHVMPDSRSKLQSTEMVDKLRARLLLSVPQYMCPSIIVPLDDESYKEVNGVSSHYYFDKPFV
ncbi:MAG: hypothetical protein M1818_004933 [Claussenomyces sp. TS43310]|nr:MAG: hypothetical protein M1818_004933 [Claussenomyces sp. TS43310]